MIPEIEKSGWSNSDIKREYPINSRLKSRADIVLTFEDKPLVIIEIKLIPLGTKEEVGMQLIRHAHEIKARYAMVCSGNQNYLIDIEKTKITKGKLGKFIFNDFESISKIDSIITPDQARGLEDV